MQKLGQWVEAKGMQNVTYMQLRTIMGQVDTNRSGLVLQVLAVVAVILLMPALVVVVVTMAVLVLVNKWWQWG